MPGVLRGSGNQHDMVFVVYAHYRYLMHLGIWSDRVTGLLPIVLVVCI